MEAKKEGAFISPAEFPRFVEIFPFDREKDLLLYFRPARWGDARVSFVSPGRSVATSLRGRTARIASGRVAGDGERKNNQALQQATISLESNVVERARLFFPASPARKIPIGITLPRVSHSAVVAESTRSNTTNVMSLAMAATAARFQLSRNPRLIGRIVDAIAGKTRSGMTRESARVAS